MVRIERVATTKIDAKKLLAAPACSARCEVSMGSQPIPGSECLLRSVFGAPLIVIRGGAFDIRAKNKVFWGILANPPKEFPRPALQSSMNRTTLGVARGTPRRSGAGYIRASKASFPVRDNAVVRTSLTTSSRPGTLSDRSRAE